MRGVRFSLFSGKLRRLARAAVGPARARRLPAGCLGALVLVLIAEGWIARHPTLGLTAIQWEYRQSRAIAGGDVNDCPILTFGDSMMKLGLAPAELKAATGRRAYNFAMTAAQPPAAYYLLRRALRAGARPEAVVLECFPNLLANDPGYNLDHWPLLLDDGELVDLAEAAGRRGDAGPLLARRWLPSVLGAFAIRRRIAAAITGGRDIEVEGLLIGTRNWTANRGYQANSAPEPPPDLNLWQFGYFRHRHVHPTNRHYIHKFLQLAEDHGIAVFWLLPPYQPELQLACERSGFDRFHEGFVRAILERHPQVRVIDGRHAGYDPAAFQDPHHLIVPGAQVLSRDVGAIVRRHLDAGALAGGPWESLPPYRPATTRVAAESMDWSREVVVRAGLIRR